MAEVRDRDRAAMAAGRGQARGRRAVAIGIRDVGLHQQVLDHLQRDPRIEVAASLARRADLLRALAQDSADLLVLCPEMAADLGRPVGQPHSRPLLMVAEHLTIPVLRTAIDAGATAVFGWPDERVELTEAVAAASLQPSAESQVRGRVVAVFGARGGSGATFVACQLAAAYADQGRSCALVDMDAAFDELRVALAVDPLDESRTLADLVPVMGELEPSHVEDALLRHQRGFSVLLAGTAMPDGRDVPVGLYRAAVAFLAGTFQTVVLHLPRSFEAPARAGAALADAVVLLVAPEVFAIHAARRTIDALGLGRHPSLHIVLNPLLRGEIGPAAAARVLGRPVASTIRFDPAVRRAQERGQLLRPGNRRAARDVASLARSLLADSPSQPRTTADDGGAAR